MAKPRIFISSTYYDLKYLRGALQQFVTSMGYESVLFEKGDIPFGHDKSLEESCIQEVGICDILILVVGGRYGSLSRQQGTKKETDTDAVAKVKSITRQEYEKARERDIPIFIFVESGVLGEYKTYQKNKSKKEIEYAHVDDTRVFELIEDIMKEKRNNFVREFSSADDIVSWLRDQWSGIFAELLRKKADDEQLRGLKDQVNELSQLVKSMKAYSEVIMKKVAAGTADEIIKGESDKRVKEFFKRIGKQIHLPKFLIENHGLKKSPEKIVEDIVRSKNYSAFIKSSLEQKEAEEVLRVWDEKSPAGRDYLQIKKEYNSLLESLKQ